MPYQLLEPPPQATSSPGRLVVPGLVLVLALVSATGFAAVRPMRVVVDGRTLVVPAGETVGSLRERGAFAAAPGDLRDVTGAVVERGGGEPCEVRRNGLPVSDDRAIYPGDVLTSRRGTDTTEATEVVDVPVPFDVRVSGRGPVVLTVRDGMPGVRRVTRGAVSHIEVASVLVREPVDQVVVRRSPRPGSKLVALTFDDGPSPAWTGSVLRALEKDGVRGTFFVVGRQARRHAAIVRRVSAAGHLIGSHGLTHARFSKLSAARVRSEVLGSRRLLRDATGVASTWVRPPYGAMNNDAWREMHRLGARVVLWDVDPRDWERPGPQAIAKRVVARVRPGSIVLLHDGGGDRSQTVRALPIIIKELRERGYEFVTVEELVEAGGVTKAPPAAALAAGRAGAGQR